jgi:hypothetical protein
MQKGNNEPQELINKMKRKEQTQALDATDAAALGAAAGSAGAAGYYGAKLGADKVKQKLDFQQAMFEADVDDPFIYQEPPDIPEVEGGFGSPEQQKAAREASAGKRRVQTAIKPQDLFVPETGPGGERLPGFRHYMKTPGESNPNLGKLFDYVTEGTTPLLKEFENLNDPNVIDSMDPNERAGRLQSLSNVLAEVGDPRKAGSAFEGKIFAAARDRQFGITERQFDDFMRDLKRDGRTIGDPGNKRHYDLLLELQELDAIEASQREGINYHSNPDKLSPRQINKRRQELAEQYYGSDDTPTDIKNDAAKRRRLSTDPVRNPGYYGLNLGGYENEYRKMVEDDFGKKIEMGLDNARRYLDQRQVAKTLVRRRPEFMKGAIKSVGTAASLVPDPTDLAMLALAAPYEIMFETGIGEEPGTGTFDIPLAKTLGNASRLLDKPLDSRELNEATRIRLAEDDYDLASALFNQDVLSKEAFDHVTKIRKSRGLDTTVLPERKEKPKAPEPEPAMGRPGRRF